MQFNSFHFLLFFPTAVILYYLLPYKYRKYFLLAASCYFYMVFIPYYILILFGLIGIDYFAGIAIEGSEVIKRRKLLLILSIAANLGLLASFKYYNFFLENVNHFLTHSGIGNSSLRYLSLALPIGLSFHILQSISYLIEVYRKNQLAERNFFTYALYIMFFPQLVAGPIERPQSLLAQLNLNYDVDYSRIVYGLKQMLWGLFKKIVIADRLAVLVKQGYGGIDNHDGPSLIIYTYLFAFQIYCDFSGYTDIAIGAAKVLGINLTYNFKTPYGSSSVREFWRRWHISLSSWFRDYVYIPLGGRRVDRSRWFYNLMVVFSLSAFWHGGNWTFLVWGALNCIFIIIEYFYKKYIYPLSVPVYNQKSIKARLTYYSKVFLTFNLISLGWVFFKAKNISDAGYIIYKIFTFKDYDSEFSLSFLRVNEASSLFVTLGLLAIFLISDSFMDKMIKQKTYFGNRKLGLITFATIFSFILLFGHFSDTNFIYFQF